MVQPSGCGAFSREILRRLCTSIMARPDDPVAAAGAVDHDAIVRMPKSCSGVSRPALWSRQRGQFQGGECVARATLEQVHFALAVEAPDIAMTTIYTAQI